jgi:hypothetical protein
MGRSVLERMGRQELAVVKAGADAWGASAGTRLVTET